MTVVVPKRSFPPSVERWYNSTRRWHKGSFVYTCVHCSSEITLKFSPLSGQIVRCVIKYCCEYVSAWIHSSHCAMRNGWLELRDIKIKITHILWPGLYHILVFYNSPCIALFAPLWLVSFVDNHCQGMNQHLCPARVLGLFMLPITFRWSWILQWP